MRPRQSEDWRKLSSNEVPVRQWVLSPITYALKGKQYIAVMTGDNPKMPELLTEFPELKTPRQHNAIHVFALP